MKKLVPFKKDIPFDTMISEVNSISLEHIVDKKSDNLIIGKFIVSGDYKMTPSTKVLDKFEYELPFNINVDKKYDIDASTVDISDFYYEIINNKTLSVNIELTVDDVKEREIEDAEIKEKRKVIEKETNNEERKTEKQEPKTQKLPENHQKENSDKEENRESKEESRESKEENKHKEESGPKEEVRKENQMAEEKIKKESTSVNTIQSIFGTLDENESYVTYKVHVITENDTIDSISTLYGVAKDSLKDYNNLDDIKIGAKLIIPANENQ